MGREGDCEGLGLTLLQMLKNSQLEWGWGMSAVLLFGANGGGSSSTLSSSMLSVQLPALRRPSRGHDHMQSPRDMHEVSEVRS